MNIRRASFSASSLPRQAVFSIARIVLLYAAFAGLWILLSDGIVARFFTSPSSMQIASTLKGLVFVTVTSVLLFLLVLRFAARRYEADVIAQKVGSDETGAPLPTNRRIAVASALVIGVFFLLAAIGIVTSNQRHQTEAQAHLQAIATLKVRQIENWLDERRGDAEVIRNSYLFRLGDAKGKSGGKPMSQQEILSRMEKIQRALKYDAVWLCDSEGKVLMQTDSPAAEVAPELRQAVARALARRQIEMTDLYRPANHPHEHVYFDIAIPLLSASAGPHSAVAVILRVNVQQTLYAFLQSWPVPSATAETLLFRRDGDTVLFLNELRHVSNAALSRRVSLADSDVLAVQALAPGYQPDTLLDGIDYRRLPVFGVAQPVAGTSWILIAKADRGEVLASAHKDAIWISIASLLVLLAAASLSMLVYQRRELNFAARQRQEQAERLHVLQLLDAILSSSTDVIYVKDVVGRYLLVNGEAARVAGKVSSDILGHDDRHLFPSEQAEIIMATDQRLIAEGKVDSFQETLQTAVGERIFSATKGPVYDADGKIIGIYGVLRDITEVKHAEMALSTQAQELLARNEELERFNRVVVGRELDMIALKRLANNLSRELGRQPPFALDFLGAPAEVPRP